MIGQDYKRCAKCREKKPLEDFYPELRVRDQRTARCRDCINVKKRTWQAANPDRAAAASKRWAKANPKRSRFISRRWKEENPERVAALRKRWEQENPERRDDQRQRYANRYPERIKANRAVANAVNRGTLIKPDHCEDCGAEKEKRLLHGHHHDYFKPLEVEWLCPACHAERHKRPETA